MNKIRIVSRIFRYLFTFLFVLLPLTSAAFWISAPHAIGRAGHHLFWAVNYIPKEVIITHLNANTKLLAFFVSLIPIIIFMFMVFYLIRLFRNFESADIFSLSSVNAIKKTGIMLLISQIVAPFYDILISLVLTWHNPKGLRYAYFTFTGMNLALILTAVIIILIAWIMAEGHKIDEENKYTV